MAHHGSSPPPLGPDLEALLRSPLDLEAWRRVSSPRLHVRIGNLAPAVGRETALILLTSFFARVERIGCRYFDGWRRRETIFLETDVCFRDAAGDLVELPCAVVARTHDDELLDLRLYLDPSPIP